MEYRRRRKRRRRHYGYAMRSRAQARAGGSGGFLSALLIVLLTAGLIYMLFATSVGTWLAKNVFSPIFTKKNAGTASPQSPIPSLLSPSPDETPPAGNKSTETLPFPAAELYVLQMGAYSNREYAAGLVASLKSLGAAGYEYTDEEGNIRVLASAYTTEAAASSVSERLTEQGYECAVQRLGAEGVSIDVTADDGRMDTIKQAVSYAAAVINDLSGEVIDFDTEERSVDYGRAIANEMLANVKNIRADISGISERSGVLKKLDAYYMELAGMLTDFISADSDNRVEMSGRLKYLQIDVFVHYCGLLDSIRGL